LWRQEHLEITSCDTRKRLAPESRVSRFCDNNVIGLKNKSKCCLDHDALPSPRQRKYDPTYNSKSRALCVKRHISALVKEAESRAFAAYFIEVQNAATSRLADAFEDSLAEVLKSGVEL
jgi:hypothetical protein